VASLGVALGGKWGAGGGRGRVYNFEKDMLGEGKYFVRVFPLYIYIYIPSLGCQTKQGPPTFLALRVQYSRTVLAYSRTSFTQTPVDAWRKITFAAPAQNASSGIYPNFRVTRAVLIYDRFAIYTKSYRADFAHGGQT
jgi:hypothetical protein